MKASLKLVTSEKKTNYGYPIYVFLRSAGETTKKLVLGHSAIAYWDHENKVILKQHDGYDELIVRILDFKARINQVNYGDFDFLTASKILFDEVQVLSQTFYDLALKECYGPSASINITSLNSFNSFYPGVSAGEITRDMVENYMKLLLIKNSPNGVHTYLRKLQTLFSLVGPVDNPFKGIRPKKTSTPNKELSDADLKIFFNTRTISYKEDHQNNYKTVNEFRYYFMLMFYLGGIDFIDLANLRYDKHVINGRVQFKRFKGGTDANVNNKMFDSVFEILSKFDCYPYLVPIYKRKDYKSYIGKINKYFNIRTEDLGLQRIPKTKSARYSFINRAQQLLVDERITMEIVGHSKKSVHSIYTNEFPLSVRDESHKLIISL